MGAKLVVTDDYFDKVYECLFEIGLQLAHVLWRSLNKSDRSNADKHIVEKAVELIHEEKFGLSSRVSDFFLKGMKSEFSSERIKREALINLAYCYKKMEDNDHANSVLDGEDWSAVGPDLMILIHILRSNFLESANLMRALEATKANQKEEYYTNPLYSEFVRTTEFLDMFKEIYNEDYALAEEPPNDALVNHDLPDSGELTGKPTAEQQKVETEESEDKNPYEKRMDQVTKTVNGRSRRSRASVSNK